MRNHEVFASLLWVILGGVICLASVSLRLGSWHFPGPGLFPFLIGSTIVLLSFGRGILVYFKTPSRFQFWPHSAGLKRILLLFACLMFYAATLKHLGFLACTFLFFILVSKGVAEKNWKFSFSASLATSILTYWMFYHLLKINLPKGFFGW